MCYLIAKEFDKSCIAVKIRHGKALAGFTEKFQERVPSL